jgi:hypothetical protein
LYHIYKCMIFLVTHCKLAHKDFIFKSRYNKNISSICTLCETGDENIYHFLLVCSSLKSTRERHAFQLVRVCIFVLLLVSYL